MSRVIINNNFNSVRVNTDNPNIIEVATPGPKGDKGEPAFPFTGSAEITGSLNVIGEIIFDINTIPTSPSGLQIGQLYRTGDNSDEIRIVVS